MENKQITKTEEPSHKAFKFENGKLFCWKEGRNKGYECIGNFTLELKGSCRIVGDADVTNYVIIFTNYKGKETRILTPITALADVGRFRVEMLKHGGSFSGTSKELSQWLMVMLGSKGLKEYHLVRDIYGKHLIKGRDLWIFRNGYYVEGEFYRLKTDKDYSDAIERHGIYFEFDDSKGKNNAPYYTTGYEGTKDVSDIVCDVMRFFPEKKTAIRLILAFYASSLRYQELMDSVNSIFHPILQVSGKTSTGKTELFSLLNNLIGLSDVKPTGWLSATPFMNQKDFSTKPNFIVWRDEFREKGLSNSEKAAKNEMLRSVFNFSGGTKGTKEQGVNYYPIKSCLILTGEDIPEDDAIVRRCISVVMGGKDKVGKDDFYDIKDKAKEWFKFWNFVVEKKLDKDKFAMLAKQISPIITGAISQTLDTDILSNYTYMLSVYGYFFCNSDKEVNDVVSEAIKYLKIKFSEQSCEGNVYRFFETVAAAIHNRGKTLPQYVDFSQREGIWYVSIWMAGLKQVLGNNVNDDNLTIKSIISILKEENGAVTGVSHKLPDDDIEGGTPRRVNRTCIEMDLEKAPLIIKDQWFDDIT